MDDVTVGQTINVDVNPSPAARQISQAGHAPSIRTHASPLAEAGQRFAAWAVDFVLVWAVLLAASAIGVVVGGAVESEVFAGLLVLFAFVLVLLYEIVYPAHCGQTFGKHVLGIEIVRLDDGTTTLGGGMAIGRQLVKGLGANVFGLGLLWILADSHRQGWHDKAAGTLVVRSDQPRLNIWQFLGQPFVIGE